jgi:glycosyltransferase 2 family protein
VIGKLRGYAVSPAARLCGLLLGGTLIMLLGWRLYQSWQSHPVALDRADPAVTIAAIAASGAAMTCYALVWPVALRACAAAPSGHLLAVFYAAQLGKYLPGAAWQYVGRAGLVVRRGVPATAAVGSLVLEAAASATAALLVAPAAFGRTGLVVAGGLVAAVVVVVGSRPGRRLASRAGSVRGVPISTLAALVLRYAAVWVVFGVAFWLAARALFMIPAGDLARLTGVFAAAWVAGFVVVFAPGGLGVREAVIVALLRRPLGEAEAIILAAASRIIFTVVDLAAGSVALLVLSRHGETAGTVTSRQ